ncbi:retron system putative HNH endonuclease [Pseudomonas sp. GD03766]|uniref:retron system putative HNH endonuclease n=1 Tax=Pseudomonas TaxID=286 RepID=UPI002448930F|nr:retron system putative HNH endonuclease [Pseudomonas sp. GD03766]MDH1692588.1 TIGR02646 family protein [Pseudomonas sp. GD03766]
MRHIAKKECTFKPLNIANLSPPKTSQDATLKWKEFRWHKQKLLKLLLREQHSVCCYSEIDAKEHGFRYHIEHVMNKSEYPLHTFDYKNLAASALADDDIKSIKANGFGSAFGGHAHGKSKTVDTRLFVSPHLRDCERFFSYLSDGRVVPAEKLNEEDKQRATYTINTLNLNNQLLIQLRRSWSDELSSYIDEHLSNQQHLDNISQIYLNTTENKLTSFYSLTREIMARHQSHCE